MLAVSSRRLLLFSEASRYVLLVLEGLWMLAVDSWRLLDACLEASEWVL